MLEGTERVWDSTHYSQLSQDVTLRVIQGGSPEGCVGQPRGLAAAAGLFVAGGGFAIYAPCPSAGLGFRIASLGAGPRYPRLAGHRVGDSDAPPGIFHGAASISALWLACGELTDTRGSHGASADKRCGVGANGQHF